MKTMQFCPYTGRPRHPDDIKSDPQGLLIVEDGQALNSACPDHSDGRHVFDEMGPCYGKTCKAKQQEASKPGPMAATVEEAARDVSKCLNERDGQGLDLRHVAMLVHHAQMSTFTPDVKTPSEPSPTAGMNMAQRILHVGGRNNAAGYVEFGSVQAVQALVRQFVRDMAPASDVQSVPDVLEQIANEPPINGNSIAQARILMKAAELRAKAAPEQQAESPCACWPGRMCSRPGQCAIDAKRTQLRDALAQALGSTYVCNRVWSAWQHGTMTADDFTPAAECDEVLAELVAAVESIKE